MRTVRTTVAEIWCDDCPRFLAKHRGISGSGGSAYGGLELAPWLVPTGSRTFGPNARGRSRGASSAIVITTAGPVTIRCKCPVMKVVDVPA